MRNHFASGDGPVFQHFDLFCCYRVCPTRRGRTAKTQSRVWDVCIYIFWDSGPTRTPRFLSGDLYGLSGDGGNRQTVRGYGRLGPPPALPGQKNSTRIAPSAAERAAGHKKGPQQHLGLSSSALRPQPAHPLLFCLSSLPVAAAARCRRCRAAAAVAAAPNKCRRAAAAAGRGGRGVAAGG